MSYYRLIESRQCERESLGCAWAFFGALLAGLMLAATLVHFIVSH